jgi:hypothetical protein
LRGAFLWGPRKFLICGESGGIGRLNDDGVISQCDPIAEHERNLHNFSDFLLFLCLFQKKVVSLQRFYYMPIIDGIDV